MTTPAVFLDRDGTINEDVGYPGRPSQIRVYPRSYEAVRRINAAGFLAVVVTNQSGVGRGYFTESDLAKVHAGLRGALSDRGARLDAIYYCPHYELSAEPAYRRDCDCRKPSPALGRRAAADLGIDLERSYMVGDKVEDILFGRNIGATPVLVLTGYGRESRRRLEEEGTPPAAVAEDLLEAVDWILAREGRARP